MLSGQSKGVMESVRQQLATNKSVEIAGYMLSSSLASGLERTALLPPDRVGDGQQVEWFEVSTREEVSLSLISQNTVAKWRERGFGTNNHAVNGPAFWQTSEIEDAQALISATTIALSAGRG
jgi:uncharacterized protein